MWLTCAVLSLIFGVVGGSYLWNKRMIYVRSTSVGARSESGLTPTSAAFGGLFLWLSVVGIVEGFKGVWWTILGNPDGPYIAAWGVVSELPLLFVIVAGRYVRQRSDAQRCEDEFMSH